MPATERPRRSAAPRAPAPFAALAGNASESVVRKGAERPRLHWDRLRHAMVDPVLQARVECDLRLAQAPDVQGAPAPGSVDPATPRGLVAAARGRAR
jgi:hypothetical protein